jgi:hypothetical protein
LFIGAQRVNSSRASRSAQANAQREGWMGTSESDCQMEAEEQLMSDVSVTQVVRNFAEYVNRVAQRRESFTLLRGRKPLVELCPLPNGVLLSELPGLLASLPRLTEAEAGEFAADLEAARDELSEARDAWQS